MRRMYDAAYPPPRPPAWEIAAGYIGGDTPHVWTRAEWNAQPARWRLPIWTRSNPGSAAQGAEEALIAVAWVRAEHVPAGSAIALDYELAENDSYLSAFDDVVYSAGYRTVLYGSLSTVMHNRRPSGGYWIGHYTGTPHLEPGSVATQYADDQMLGVPYDASLVTDGLVLWDTSPQGPVPSPVPDPPGGVSDVTDYFPIQVGPDPTGAHPWSSGVATWPAGSAHVLQLVADPGQWADTEGQFRLVFALETGPDATYLHLAKPGETAVIEFANVPRMSQGICRGVTITRPDNKTWPWGGGAR